MCEAKDHQVGRCGGVKLLSSASTFLDDSFHYREKKAKILIFIKTLCFTQKKKRKTIS